MKTVLALVILAFSVLIKHVEMGEEDLTSHMVRDDPSTWVCHGRLLHHTRTISMAVNYCNSRAGNCKNMCYFQHIKLINEEFKVDEPKTKIIFDSFIPDPKDADTIFKKVKACGEKLIANDTSLDCIGNEPFYRCAKVAFVSACNISASEFGLKPEMQGRSISGYQGKLGYNYMNKNLARSIAEDLFEGKESVPENSTDKGRSA